MSLLIYVSHTGQTRQLDNSDIRLEEIRSWIEKVTSIPQPRQILMSARGKNVKNPSTESEIFVYDKHFLTPDSEPPSERLETLSHLGEPPSSLADEKSLAAWQDLFMARRTWALEAVDIVKNGIQIIETCGEEAEIIYRSTEVALNNLRTHIDNLGNKFETTLRWADDCIQENEAVLNDWQGSIQYLAELPVREDVAVILKKPTDRLGRRASTTSAGTLLDLLDQHRLSEDASRLQEASTAFSHQVYTLTEVLTDLKKDSINAQSPPVQPPDVDAEALLEEVEALARRINNDYEDVLQLADDQKGPAAASRKAIIHTRDLLPAIEGTITDVREAMASYLDYRNHAAASWYTTLQLIATLQSHLASFQSRVSSLSVNDGGSLENLSKVFQLPTVYGATMVEAIRRSEWTERMRAEIEGTRENISVQTEEEQRRRKQWSSSYSQYLNEDSLVKDSLLDLKVSSPRNTWPFVNRDEIEAWIDDLKALRMDDAVENITQMLHKLDVDDRETAKSHSLNKNSRSSKPKPSTTTVNDDELKQLQDDKARFEEKLRAADSRVRKLEDLLHRQSQSAQQASGSFVPGITSDFERQVSMPTPGTRQSDLTRRSSTSSRRLSLASDDRAMAQRIVSLETQIQKLQEETYAERRSSSESRGKMQEAEQIKHDLMANFESQRQEFDDERQLLEDENHKLKVKIDELEDELDRVLGSRDHQKMQQDQTITMLRVEIEQLRKTSSEEVNQLKRKHEAVFKDLTAQRERSANLEKQSHQYREDRQATQAQNLNLANELRAIQDQHKEFLSTLQSTHSNLSPAGSAPEDLKRLVNAVEILSEGVMIHARGLDDAIQISTAENKALEEKVENTELQVKQLKERLVSANGRADYLRDTLDQERGKLAAVQAELAGEQVELDNLRAKFAAGETGSDALKEQLRLEEKQVADLLSQKAENESTIHLLQHEITAIKEKSQDHFSKVEQLESHLQHRGEKARQLSERLFQHNDRVVRMLEQFGYLVSRQDDSLVIQRASKVNASTLLSGNEGSSSMKRTVSGSTPIQHYSDISDAETIYWTSDVDLTTEDTKFQTFSAALQRIDLEGTIDMMTKRYKDVESLAKKYQKETRAYREKIHRLQSEAHEKIAYRSFKEGDLALFLPTRNQATRPWAAFNVGAPHYFLREQDVHKLQSREWLLARIGKIEERVVDLSRSMTTGASDGGSTRSIDDENPFELSDGLRWYLLDALEEKPGAPGTPSVGKSTVIASNVEVKGHLGRKDKSSGVAGTNTALVAKTLSKSLDSRRSSSTSKKSVSLKNKTSDNLTNTKDTPAPLTRIASDQNEPLHHTTVKPSPADSQPGQSAREDARLFDVNTDRIRRSGPRLNLPQSPSGQTEVGQTSSRAGSPLKERVTSPSKSKQWDKLFNMEYQI